MGVFTWEGKDKVLSELNHLLQNQNKFSFTENKVKSFNSENQNNIH